jgi:hypothetical protein
MEALRQAAASNPNGRGWIKADACDVCQDLRERVRAQWAGNEDLGDGYVQELYQQYKADCSFVEKLTASDKLQFSRSELHQLNGLLENSVEFLSSGKAKAKDCYEKVLQASCPSEKSLMELFIVNYFYFYSSTNSKYFSHHWSLVELRGLNFYSVVQDLRNILCVRVDYYASCKPSEQGGSRAHCFTLGYFGSKMKILCKVAKFSLFDT